MQLEQIGSRLYVTGTPFALKDSLKAAGCHWDTDRRAWWIGATKRNKIEHLIAQPIASASEEEQQAERLKHDQQNILGTAKFNSKSYYLVGSGTSARGEWVRLLFRDGSQTFFKPSSEVEIVKRYAKPTTLAKLQAFAEKLKIENDPSAAIVEECWECGAQYKTFGNVESGNMGCRRCG